MNSMAKRSGRGDFAKVGVREVVDGQGRAGDTLVCNSARDKAPLTFSIVMLLPMVDNPMKTEEDVNPAARYTFAACCPCSITAA